MHDSVPYSVPVRMPSATRPLLGLTILVVEDSLYACDALRLLCLRSGARIRRADCLKSARRHLRVYRPSVIIIDLGLPDGSGLDLIEELDHAQPRVELILATSGDDFVEDAAIAAGADGFLAKPLRSLCDFQQAILSRLPAPRAGPAVIALGEDRIEPDPIAYQDDMAHVADILSDHPDRKMLTYVAQFVSGVARSAGDTELVRAAERLSRTQAASKPIASEAARMAGLVQNRLNHKQAI
jgi:DNA-binding response OmpR family regulator